MLLGTTLSGGTVLISKRNARRVLKQLGIAPDERHALLREARRLARKSDRPWGEYAMYWLSAIIGATVPFAFVAAFVDILVPGASASLEVTLSVLAAAIFLWGAFRLFFHIPFGDPIPHLVRLLHGKGYRYCRNCHYDLRSLPAETDTCPECGTYISPHFTGDVESAPPVMARLDRIPKLGAVTVVHGIELRPAQLEQAWMMQRRMPSAWQNRQGTILVSAIFIALLVCTVLLAVWLQRLFPHAPSGVLWLAGFGIFAVIWIVVFWTCLLLGARRGARRMRMALRQMGTELCVHCGQYLGDLESTVTACPRCHRPRARFPERVPIGDTSSSRP
jgi:protein-S-isoprenylcysteine O-methyltransferase Ste14